tara:strand:- start:142 stop:612 length:471 start_codon:yes stop_codon:yes gene_type:complete
MTLNAILARSKNNVIGNDKKLVWNFRCDMKFFKEITMGHTVIMGRKTYESIGKPLPNRLNIVLSRQDLNIKGVIVVKSIEEALRVSKNNHDTNPFIIGGAEVYKLAEPYIDKYFITDIDKEYDGDTYFQNDSLKLIQTFKVEHEQGVKLSFSLYTK